MRSSLIVLAEVPLRTSDAMTALMYLGLDPAENDDAIAVRALVPCGSDGDLLTSLLDAGDLAELRAAGAAVLAERAEGRRVPEPAPGADDRPRHGAVLDSVVSAFRRVGCAVEGTPCGREPLAAVRSLLEDCSSQAVVVFSDPERVDASFAEDWAHRVEDHLSATVIHLSPAAL